MDGEPLWEWPAAGVYQGTQIVYCYPAGTAPLMAVRGDGALVIAEPTNAAYPPLTVIAPPGGFGVSPFIPPSTLTDTFGNQQAVQCCVGPPMVNSDGAAYVEYEVRNNGPTTILSDTLYLMQVNPDNTYTSTLLSSTTQNEALRPGNIIPDGQGGVLATWTISPSSGPVPQFPYQAVDVVAGVVGTPYNLPFSPTTVTLGQYPTLVLGEGGVAFASGPSTTTDGTNTAVSQIASFNASSGAPNWTYQAASATTLSIVAATRGNGVIVKTANGTQPEAVVALDASGHPSVNGGASVGNQTDYSWWGDWNMFINGAASEVAAQRAQVADDSPSPTPRGNPSHTGKAVVRCAPLDSAPSTLVEGAFSNLNTFLLSGPCTFCINHIFEPLSTSQAAFKAYLSQGHEFCDGNKSQEPGSMIGSTKDTVALEFAANAPAPGYAAAITEVQSPMSFGPFGIFQSSQLPNLRVFLAPQNLGTDSTFVESILFHEGLHGQTLKGDTALCSILNVPSENANCWDQTVDISCWIAKEVFVMPELPEGPQFCPADVQF